MYGLDALVARATPPYNVLGSTLFLSYIVLALYFTTSILLSLYRQYIAIFFSANAAKDDKKTEAIKSVRARHINIYAFLSSISFATLSYHMLGFLIASYTNWAGPQGLWETDMTIESLKSWMLETSLFESFAKELVRDGPSTAWTQAAIVGTWFWNIWMAGKASERRFDRKMMFPYIMLGQILPVSLTVSLFVIQLHLSSSDLQSSAAPASEKQADTANTNGPNRPKKTYKKTSLTLPTILLNASLIALPRLRNHLVFIPLVLMTRVILLLPHSGRVSLRGADVMQSISISGGFVVANLVITRKAAGWRDVARGLWTGGQAVKALGWDGNLGAVVYVVLGWGGGV